MRRYNAASGAAERSGRRSCEHNAASRPPSYAATSTLVVAPTGGMHGSIGFTHVKTMGSHSSPAPQSVGLLQMTPAFVGFMHVFTCQHTMSMRAHTRRATRCAAECISYHWVAVSALIAAWRGTLGVGDDANLMVRNAVRVAHWNTAAQAGSCAHATTSAHHTLLTRSSRAACAIGTA